MLAASRSKSLEVENRIFVGPVICKPGHGGRRPVEVVQPTQPGEQFVHFSRMIRRFIRATNDDLECIGVANEDLVDELFSGVEHA